MNRLRAFSCAAVIAAATFASCASPARLRLFDLDAESSDVPVSCLHSVPHIAQRDGKSCATTAAAMAISFYRGADSAPIDKETAWVISGAKESDVAVSGNDMDALLRLARHYGYAGEFARNLTVGNLETLLSHGVLAVLNIKARETGSQTHAVLAVGYNRDERILYVADPAFGPEVRAFPYAALEARWAASLSHPRAYARRSGFVIYPKR